MQGDIWRPPDASIFLTAGFAAFGAGLAALFIVAVFHASRGAGESRERTSRRTGIAAALTVAWLAGTWLVADAGLLARDGTPPPFALLVGAVFGLSIVVAFSRTGTLLAERIPLATLIAFQGYRFPLELLMHRAARDGVMPEQMSYSGANWDILSGITALIVGAALARGRAGRGIAWAWNVLGSILLANILIVAIRSTPFIAAYGSDRLNTWVMYPPFVWLPAVMVLLALAGHAIVFRALLIQGSAH